MAFALVDKGGELLLTDEWLRRVADPVYCVSRRIHAGGYILTASWVGLATPLSPGTWCVRVQYARRDANAAPLLARPDRWCFTEREALEAADALETKIRSGDFLPERD